jgi:hypothetical protein
VLQEEISQYMHPASRLNGSFDMWINEVGRSRSLATNVSKSLLSFGQSICQGVDESAYRCLIESVRKASGVGDGVFHATLTEMPETFARAQMKLWRMDDSLDGISEARWDVVLNHALTNKRPSLGLDIIKQMESRFGRYPVAKALSQLDDKVMATISVIWKPYADSLVTELCNRKRYSSALNYAGSDPSLQQSVLESIGFDIGFRGVPSGWPEMMRFMIKRARVNDSKDSIMDQYKSAGTVVVEKILSMDEQDIKRELNTDELRLMAFQWGLDKAVKQIDSLKAKGRALEHSLGL